MSEDDRITLDRLLGRLEGRVNALELGATRMNVQVELMDKKLDTIMAKLNQSMGGLAAGKLFAAIVAAIGSAAWAAWSHFYK